jgi:ferritin-like protein
MSEYHEPESELSPEIRNVHRALTSLKEELEAVDWYNQRWEACPDPSLKAILAHNRDEEMEHACMVIEWLRRNVPAWDAALRTYVFTTDPITEIEENTKLFEGGRSDDGPSDGGNAEGARTQDAARGLGIGALGRTK